MNPVYSCLAQAQPNGQVCPLQQGCVSAALALADRLPDDPEVRDAKTKLLMFVRVVVESQHGKPLGVVGDDQPDAGPQSEINRISISRRGIVRRGLTKDERERLKGMSARATSMALRLTKRGWFDLARHSMAMGRHPGGDDALAMVCQFLLDGGISRRELVPTLMDRFDMKEPWAKVAASALVAVLKFGQLATVTKGRLVHTPTPVESMTT